MNRTKIQWTDFTANPIRYKNADGLDVWACSKVSQGCKNCYAEALAKSPRMVSKGRALGADFNDGEMAKLRPYLDDTVLGKLLRAKPRGPFRNGDRPMVFLGDMTDIFGAWVRDEWLDAIFATMALRPDITFQVLTKRPERMREFLTKGTERQIGLDGHGYLTPGQVKQHGSFAFDSQLGTKGRVFEVMTRTGDDEIQAAWRLWRNTHAGDAFAAGGPMHWPLQNVWLGTSVEDQAAADLRIPELLATPAAVRFLSCEPLLGPVDIRQYLFEAAVRVHDEEGWGGDLAELEALLHWVIVGGESGGGARPCDIAWIRSLRDQCREAGVPVFVKQLGAFVVTQNANMDDFGEDEDGFDILPRNSAWGESFASVRYHFRDRHGGDMAEWPEDLRVREFPAVVA